MIFRVKRCVETGTLASERLCLFSSENFHCVLPCDDSRPELIAGPPFVFPTTSLPPTPMMTMSSIPDTLVPPDPSKSAFLEFSGHSYPGHPGHQQPSPGLSHNHYPVHGLHAVGPSQHDGPFSSGASSYGRPLGYPPYHSPVSAHHPGAYLPYQHGGHGGALGHTRLEDAGKLFFFARCILTKAVIALFLCAPQSLSTV